jgi:hypothetical protein
MRSLARPTSTWPRRCLRLSPPYYLSNAIYFLLDKFCIASKKYVR